MNVDAYLERIAHPGEGLAVSASTLRSLHVAHSLAVTFETFDVAQGRTPSLAPDALFDKVVRRRRGGYCFELNGLFALLLEELGFSVRRLAGRVTLGYDGVRPCTHQVLLVDVGGRNWLVDVGFGDGVLAPLPLETGRVDVQPIGSFRLVDHGLGHMLQVQTAPGSDWRDLYVFALSEYLPVDYEVLNHYTATAPGSFFTGNVICTIPTERGRRTLFNRTLRERAGAELSEREVPTLVEYKQIVADLFGLQLEGDLALLY